MANVSKIFLNIFVFSSLAFLIDCSNEKKNGDNMFDSYIENFQLVGTEQIFEQEGDSIVIYVPYETDISKIKTHIITSNKTTISPASGTEMNFSNPQVFTVNTNDGNKKKYWVRVKKSPWRQVIKNEAAPFLRVDGHQMVVFKEKMWLLGGWLGRYDHDKATYIQGTNYWTSQVWCTSDGVDWESKGNAPWAGRHGFGCVVHDNKIWVIGGDQNTDVWNTDDGVHWNKIAEKVPWGERYFPYIVSFKGKIWVMGGVRIDFSAGNEMRDKYNDIWSTNDGVHWNQEVEFAKWTPRGLVSGSAILNDELYIYGGCILDSYAYDDVWKTSDGINWTKVISHAPWPSRTWGSITSFDNKLWIMAGDFDVEKQLLNDVWYSFDGVSWTQQKGIFWKPRHATSIVGFNNKLWLVGGLISSPKDNWGDVSNGVWVMDLNN